MHHLPERRWEMALRLAPLGVLILALAGGVLMLANTPYGIGVGYDSLYYINAAEGLRSGAGLVKVGSGGATAPLNHFPPLYPLGLGLVSVLARISTMEAARWLGAGLFASNIALVGLFTRWVSGTWLAGIIASAFALLSPNLLDVHLDAMSEPLFFTCLLLFLWTMSIYFTTKSIRWALVAGLAGGAATLTRYIGATVLIAGGLAILIWREGALWRRVRSACLFSAAGAVVVVPWVVRNALISGSATNREIIFHPVSGGTLRQGAITVSSWFLPNTAPTSLRLVTTAAYGAAFLLLLVAGYVRLRGRNTAQMAWRDKACLLPLLYGIVYATSLLASMTFIDASTPLTNRILSPIYLVLLLTTACLIGRLAGVVRKKTLMLSLVAVMSLALTASYAKQSADLWRDIRTQGRRLTSRTWVESETIAVLRGMPAGAIVYTNEPQPVQLYTGIPAFRAPERWDSIRDQVPEDYEGALAGMRIDLQSPNSALVIFHPSDLREETTPLEVLTEGLALVVTTDDAKIYVDPKNLEAWVSDG
jgi:hypothetical protein